MDLTVSAQGECDRSGGHKQRLHHILLQDVGDSALPHVDTGSLLTLAVEEWINEGGI